VTVTRPDVTTLQRFLPAKVKFYLKPYYRKFYRNRLHVLFWPTFRCNYRCSYCPICTQFDFSSVFGKGSERSADDWLRSFDRLPPASFYIAGGEPFLYHDLPEIINALPAKHSVLGVVTNLSAKPEVYERVTKRIHLNASLHREFVTEEAFIEKVVRLQQRFHINVNIVATPQNLGVLKQVEELMRTKNVSLHVDPYVDAGFEYSHEQLEALGRHLAADRGVVDFADRSSKSCSAGQNYINVLPNGEVFTCAAGFTYAYSTLFADITAGQELGHYRLKNLFEPGFSLNRDYMTCGLPCKDACDRDAVIIRRRSGARACPRDR
jgi:MoaA/NifB/PqqE/SkfB family radical SAM enzyme